MNGVFDRLLFAGLLILGQLLSIHGKAFSSYLFGRHGGLTRPAADHWVVYALVAATAAAFALIREAAWPSRRKALVATFLCVLSPFALRMHDTPSSLVFFLDVFFLVLVTGVIWAESLPVDSLDVRYWELLFDYSVKAAQFVIQLYAATFLVTLGVITLKSGEDAVGYITTLAYPTMVIVLALFFVGYWVMEPVWKRIASGHRERHDFKVQRFVSG